MEKSRWVAPLTAGVIVLAASLPQGAEGLIVKGIECDVCPLDISCCSWADPLDEQILEQTRVRLAECTEVDESWLEGSEIRVLMDSGDCVDDVLNRVNVALVGDGDTHGFEVTQTVDLGGSDHALVSVGARY